MLIQAIVFMLAITDPNTVGYMYEWQETAHAPTQEIQEALAWQQWEDDYVPWWYQLRYPGVKPGMWFRWERTILPTAIAWLMAPSDVNHDRRANLRDFAIVAEYHPGGLKLKPKPPEPPPSAPPSMSKLEVMAMFMELLFMETER